MLKINTVQVFIRNLIRLIVIVPLFYLLVWPDVRGFMIDPNTQVVWIIAKCIAILWAANIVAKMFYVLPQWQ